MVLLVKRFSSMVPSTAPDLLSEAKTNSLTVFTTPPSLSEAKSNSLSEPVYQGSSLRD